KEYYTQTQHHALKIYHATGQGTPRTVVVVIHDMGHVEEVADCVHALHRASSVAPGEQVAFSGSKQDWLAAGRPGRP
ncbi:MAG: hypothetical protein K2V38_13550, partial [Gemmataceae bacterium]|nr:hypothetical protein [Gemmataceae bacterium]